MSWGWPTTRGWSDAPGAGWARPTACRPYSGRTEHVYGETLYAAQSWSHRRRVIIKAEVVRLPGGIPNAIRASW